MTMCDSWAMRREVQRVWVIMVERLHPECQCPARCLLPERRLIMARLGYCGPPPARRFRRVYPERSRSPLELLPRPPAQICSGQVPPLEPFELFHKPC